MIKGRIKIVRQKHIRKIFIWFVELIGIMLISLLFKVWMFSDRFIV